MPIIAATGVVLTASGSDAFWDVAANVLSQYPALDAQGIMAYSYVVRNFSGQFGITQPIDGVVGSFIMPVLHPENTSESINATLYKIFGQATAGAPQYLFSATPTMYPDFWAWYSINNGPLDAGFDEYLGSRLLGEQALTENLTALAEAYKAATPMGGMTSAYLVGGHGVMNAKPRGGSNAVNSAWRKAYVHAGMLS